jgi:hypothetical protein
MPNRRISQLPFTRGHVRQERYILAQRLYERRGIKIAHSWGPLGFMLNRATLHQVKTAVLNGLENDPLDPIAAALEELAGN